MKQRITLLAFLAVLAGCASHSAVVPALDGRARVPVNKQIPAQPPLAQPNTLTEGE
ncbi:conjugal transfer protein TraI [Xanthomonas campestris]|uniref:conjugal transfer protein TraI n=1 Tax=Xanthomonas campestris TaxID=339 RepID=UPI002378F850|nr:conjugal transfer protein TraI [Xanthomonas campestris]WDK04514.1 conjugal transfer protein TraI [Xanthomonas campestris]